MSIFYRYLNNFFLHNRGSISLHENNFSKFHKHPYQENIFIAHNKYKIFLS